MLATQIFRDTVNDIFDDHRSSVRCLVPSLAGLLLVGFAGLLIERSAGPVEIFWMILDPLNSPELFQIVGTSLAISAVVAMSSIWTAVAWHRLIILRERPGAILPPWPGRRLLRYAGGVILVLALVFLAFVFIAPIAGLLETGDPSYYYSVGAPPFDLGLRSLAAWLLVTAALYGLWLRLALALPAIAVGRPLRLGTMWTLSENHFLRLFVPLGLLLALATFTINLVPLGGVFELLAFGVQTLLGIGILTQLYVHFSGVQPNTGP